MTPDPDQYTSTLKCPICNVLLEANKTMYGCISDTEHRFFVDKLDEDYRRKK